MNEDVIQSPIIILGSPRSGTTLLSRILGQHPDVALLIEPRMTWRYGNDLKSDMLGPDDASPRTIAHIRKRFTRFVHEQGGSRLAEKTPSNALRPAFVHKVFPDAKFVHITRNGYDACLATEDFWTRHATGLSNVAQGRLKQRVKELGFFRLPYYLPEFLHRSVPGPLKGIFGTEQWGPRLPGMGAMLKDLGPLAVSCLQWRTCVEMSCDYGRSLKADQYFELRLEDISVPLIDKLLTFCGLRPDDAVRAFIQENFDDKRAGARTRIASVEQMQEARRWIEPTVRWLGYTLPETSGA